MVRTRFIVVAATVISGTLAVTVLAPPAAAAARASISSVSSAVGPAAGGTTIVVRGKHLNKLRSVSFGSTRVTRVIRVSSRMVRVKLPKHAPGTVRVRVRDRSGASTNSRSFTFLAAPRVTGLSRSSGPLTGGVITVSGRRFDHLTRVRLGSRHVTKWQRLSSTRLVVTLPALPAGPAHLTVSGVGGRSAATARSEYEVLPKPIVRYVTPSAGRVGAAGAGATLTLVGDNLSRISRVTFGSTPARSWRVTASRTLAVVVPVLAAGRYDVRVLTPGGLSAPNFVGSYSVIPPPTVTAVNLTSGRLGGGDRITVTGTDFIDVQRVLVGGVAGTGLQLEPGHSYSVITPARAGLGATDVQVVTRYGTSEPVTTHRFEYVAAPSGTATSTIAQVPAEVPDGSVSTSTRPACTSVSCYVVGNVSQTVDANTYRQSAVWSTGGDGSWSADVLPLPDVPGVLSAELAAITCQQSSCVAVGSYTARADNTSVRRELIGTLDPQSGSWTVTAVRADEDFESDLAELTHVACSNSGVTCVASGVAYRGSKRYLAVAERTAGRWSGRVFDAGSLRTPVDVACYSQSSCLLLAEDPATREQAVHGWNGTQWTGGLIPPLPTGAGGGNLRSLTCTSGDYCVAVGNLVDADGKSQPWIVSNLNGSIASFVPPVSPTAKNATLRSVSCSSETGDCVATGTAEQDTGDVGYVVAQRAGHWIADEPVSSAPRLSGRGMLGSGCVGKVCVASGSTALTSTTTTPYFVLHSAGGWQPLPVSAPGGVTRMNLFGAACSAAGFCVAVGIGLSAGSFAYVLATVTLPR